MSLNDLFKEVVLSMYGEMCVYNCGRVAVTVHHIFPKGMGGCTKNVRYNPLNGVPLCHKCHSRIHDEIGEVAGRKEIMSIFPGLETLNHITLPLDSKKDSDIRKQLKGFLKL